MNSSGVPQTPGRGGGGAASDGNPLLMAAPGSSSGPEPGLGRWARWVFHHQGIVERPGHAPRWSPGTQSKDPGTCVLPPWPQALLPTRGPPAPASGKRCKGGRAEPGPEELYPHTPSLAWAARSPGRTSRAQSQTELGLQFETADPMAKG